MLRFMCDAKWKNEDYINLPDPAANFNTAFAFASAE
jgi:hypothetical protein